LHRGELGIRLLIRRLVRKGAGLTKMARQISSAEGGEGGSALAMLARLFHEFDGLEAYALAPWKGSQGDRGSWVIWVA
jgi:hypothetical protein